MKATTNHSKGTTMKTQTIAGHLYEKDTKMTTKLQAADTRTDWGSDKMRTAFYRMTDGCHAVQTASRDHGEDRKLQRLQAETMRAANALMDHLNDSYKWD